jgi:hypothetical protein
MDKTTIDWWKELPATKQLFKKLILKQEELSNGLLNGNSFQKKDPLLDVYRNVGVLRLVNEILSGEIFNSQLNTEVNNEDI